VTARTKEKTVTIQRLVCVGLLVAFWALPATAQDASGTWNASIKTPQGALPLVIELAADGQTLTGTFSNHFMPKIPIQDGTVVGNKLSFKLVLASMTLAYKGALDGDTLTLTPEVIEQSDTNDGQSLGSVLASAGVLTATRKR
jgi:hypothetical protein